MANTPQAKKRIRRNANRAAINGARVSRIRTFIKAVESALLAGDKGAAAEALKAAIRAYNAGRGWSPEGHVPPERLALLDLAKD